MSILDGVNVTLCVAHSSVNADSIILTTGQSIGLALSIEASFLSFCAVTVIFILIARNILRYRKAFPNRGWKLLRIPADIYMLFLFVYDLVLSIGGILNIRWVHDGVITTGPYCTTQGIMRQIGSAGVALISLMLTIHTFTTALWGIGAKARRFAFGVVALTWLFVGLWVSIGNGIHKDYEKPTSFWCWIGPKYKGPRLAGEYIWMWIALFVSAIMYVLMHFWMMGHLSVDNSKWYKFRLHSSDVAYSQRRATLGILLYPIAYSVMVIPLSVSRWLNFSQKHIPSAATLFGSIMFSLSGAINVLLFLIIRPRLLLFAPPEELGEPITGKLKREVVGVLEVDTEADTAAE